MERRRGSPKDLGVWYEAAPLTIHGVSQSDHCRGLVICGHWEVFVSVRMDRFGHCQRSPLTLEIEESTHLSYVAP